MLILALFMLCQKELFLPLKGTVFPCSQYTERFIRKLQQKAESRFHQKVTWLNIGSALNPSSIIKILFMTKKKFYILSNIGEKRICFDRRFIVCFLTCTGVACWCILFTGPIREDERKKSFLTFWQLNKYFYDLLTPIFRNTFNPFTLTPSWLYLFIVNILITNMWNILSYT